jgi:hypothetical protein
MSFLLSAPRRFVKPSQDPIFLIPFQLLIVLTPPSRSCCAIGTSTPVSPAVLPAASARRGSGSSSLPTWYAYYSWLLHLSEQLLASGSSLITCAAELGARPCALPPMRGRCRRLSRAVPLQLQHGSAVGRLHDPPRHCHPQVRGWYVPNHRLRYTQLSTMPIIDF